MTKETITVKLVHEGKWGKSLLVGDSWYNFDKKGGLTGNEFEKDKTYTVLVNESKTGKKYIAQIVQDAPVDPVVPPVKAGDDKILEAIKKENKGRDFDAEARGKVACATFCAALTSPGLAMYATSKDEYLKLVKEAAEKAIEFTWEHQRG